MALEFRGKHRDFLNDDSPERDLEGALFSGKTVVALWSELEAIKRYPGIWSYIGRWTDDATRTLLRPEFERVARLHGTPTDNWNDKLNYYEFPNGSRCYAFGLKTQSQKPEDRYGKIRGLSVSRIYIDQAEQLPEDIADETRFRLREDIEARAAGRKFPSQWTITPNAVDHKHWIAQQFPVKNNMKGRRYWGVSLYDNRLNINPEKIEQLERTFPPSHPKHRTMLLGMRGMNVIGKAIYDKLYDREHHARPIAPNYDLPFLEGFEVGQENPAWVIGQRTPYGALNLLGGVTGQNLMLEDFLPIVSAHREQWFPEMRELKTAMGPMGETPLTIGNRYTLVSLLREAGLKPKYRLDGNAADVHLACIEYFASQLRRRTPLRDECIGIDTDPAHWIVATPEVELQPCLSFALEGGYVWDPNDVSISNKKVRQPLNDDWYANAMRCVEHMTLNFCSGKPTDEELERRRREDAEKNIREYVPVSPWG